MKTDLRSVVCRCAHLAALATLPFLAAQPCMAQDSVLVGDYNGSRVVKFAFPSGTAQTHFVGTGMTALSNTSSMTYGPDGALYIASYSNSSIIKVDGQTGEPAGTFVTTGLGGLNGASSLAFGPDGKLYVTSYVSHSVCQYNGATGSFLQLFVTPSSGTLTNPTGIAFDGAGNLYVCSYGNDKVLKYNGTTGAFIEEALTAGQLGLNGPTGIRFDIAGRMYIGSRLSHQIIVKDPVAGASVLASNATIPALTQPSFLDLAANGDLIVACFQSGTVQRLNRTTGASLGTLVQANTGGMASCYSVIYKPSLAPCYANCDNSSNPPVLNVNDFVCFLGRYAAGCP